MWIDEMTSRKKVLIIDKDMYTRKFFVHFLQGFSCSVKTLGDGTEAVSLMDKEAFDLYFIDAHLPQTIKEHILLKAKKDDLNAEVFFMFGLWNETPVDIVKNECQNHYIAKPFDIKYLKRLLRRHIGIVCDNKLDF